MIEYQVELRENHKENVTEAVRKTTLKDMDNFTNLFIQYGENTRREERRTLNLLDEMHSRSSAGIEIKDLVDTRNIKHPPKSTLIRGQAGIGKTTLLRKIAVDWAANILWVSRFLYIYLFPLRLWNSFQGKLSCYDLLMKYHQPEVKDDDKEQVWKHITEHPDKVLLLFDGVDEYHALTKEAVHPIHDTRTTCTFPVLLYNLKKKNILKEASVIFTSRPWAPALDALESFDRNILITGFTEQQIDQFVQQYFKDDPDTMSFAMKYLNEKKDVKSYCYIPIFLSMTCVCLKSIRENAERSASNWESSPQTMAQLMTILLAFFIKEHHPLHKERNVNPLTLFGTLKENIWSLAKVAAWGMKSTPPKLSFTKAEVKKCTGLDITLDDLALGLLTLTLGIPHPIFRTTEEILSYIHLIFMEYLFALYLVFCEWEEIEALFEEESFSQYSVVVVFLAGLLEDPALQQILQVMISK